MAKRNGVLRLPSTSEQELVKETRRAEIRGNFRHGVQALLDLVDSSRNPGDLFVVLRALDTMLCPIFYPMIISEDLADAKLNCEVIDSVISRLDQNRLAEHTDAITVLEVTMTQIANYYGVELPQSGTASIDGNEV